MVALNNRPMATLMLAVATCAVRLQPCLALGRLPNDLASFVKDGDRLASAEKHVHGTMININWKDALPESADRWHSSDGLGAERSGGVGLDGGGLSMRAYDRNGALAKVKDEKAAAHKWKRKAQSYKDALKRGQVGDQDGDSITKCDDKGCWSIDTSDPATRATLQAFHAAAGSSQVIKNSMSGLAIAANAAVEAKTNELQSSRETEKPETEKRALKLERKCDNPYLHVKTAAEACRYVHAHCRQSSGIFNYELLPYCSMAGSLPAATLLLIAWLVTLCMWLGMAADSFLCPCLTAMSTACRMSQNVAGLTFLALGNGAPDIFSQIAATIASPHGAEMALGEMLGSSMIVAGLVFAVIAIAVPFRLIPADFLRNVLFLLISLIWLVFILLDSTISTAEALGFIVLYGLYLYAAIYGGRVSEAVLAAAGVQQSGVEHVRNSEAANGFASNKTPLRAANTSLLGIAQEAAPAGEGGGGGVTLSGGGAGGGMTSPRTRGVGGGGRGSSRGGTGGDDTLDWLQVLHYINPLNQEEMKEEGWAHKAAAGIKMPLLALMRVSSPLVDLSQAEEGWCKPAALVQITVAPLLVVWCVLLHAWPHLSAASVHLSYGCALVVGLLLAGVMHVTSRTGEAPPYHGGLAFVGFVTAITWIYVLAAELIHLLQTLGGLLSISETLMGLSVLAVANSVGDLVANLAMAKAGMPAMAAGACLGAPTLNLLLGGGLSTLLGNLLVTSPYPFELHLQVYVSVLFLIFMLVAMLVYALTNDFQVARPFGVVLILIYVAFITTCLAFEVWGGQKMLTANIGPQVREGNLRGFKR